MRATRSVRTVGLLATMAVLAGLAIAGTTTAPPVAAEANESPSASFAARSIAAGRSHTCALTADADVRCWGRNDAGQLGRGDTDNRGDGAGEMGSALPRVNLGINRLATAITAGRAHTCALLEDGDVKCWGENAHGQLGLGDTDNRGDGILEMGDALPAVALGTGRTATAISAGDDHTCAVLDNATVKCWGRNHLGQLGLGDVDSRGDSPGEMGDALPAVVLGGDFPQLFLVDSVSAGSQFTCAVSTGTQLKCWGANDRGQLGQGDEANRGDAPGEMGLSLAPVSLGFSAIPTAVSAGRAHACARLDDASLRCWGSNSFGQLGLGDALDRGDAAGEMGDALPAVSLGAGRTVTGVSAGDFHTCAVLDDGTVKCWGSNDFGEQGVGDTTIRGDEVGEMGDALPAAALGTGRTALAVTVGNSVSCARLDDRTVKCWGLNDLGQLGLGDVANRGDAGGEMGDALPTVSLTIDRPHAALSIQAGGRHSCALLDEARVRCWGNNDHGQLGRGHTDPLADGPDETGDVSPPIDLGVPFDVVAIATGGEHTCALLEGGIVKCWGLNDFGQLGLGDTANRGDGPGEMGGSLPAVNLGTGRTATAIEAGDRHTCALLDDGTVKCWGLNSSGELGLGDTSPRGAVGGQMGDNLPALQLGTGRTATAISIGATGRFGCALLDNGALRCWGRNTNGQLGLGDDDIRGDGPGEMGDSLATVPLGTGRTATSVAAGTNHVCATLENRATKCWGANANGELGLGDTARRGDQPGEMGNALPALSFGTSRSAGSLAAGNGFTCAVLDNATLKCWGRNADGQLGLGDLNARGDVAGEMGNSLPAVNLGAGRTATTVSAGDTHTCARLDGGTLKCWGSNLHGRLGLGDTNARGDGAGEMGDVLPAVDLGRTTGAAVWGRVTNATTGAPLGGVFVVVMSTLDFSIERGAMTAADGTFMTPVAPGTYFAYLLDGTGAHVSGFLGAPTTLTAVANGLLDTSGVMAPTRGSISGTITETGPATPIAGAIGLTLNGASALPEIAAVADPNGAYALPPQSTGSHFVGFVDPSGNHAPRFHPNSPNVPEATAVNIIAGTSSTANGSLPTQTATGTGAALTGTVENDLGQPLAGVMVVAMHAADFRTARVDLTDTGGGYTMDLPAGSYKMVFFDTTGRHDMEWHANQPYFGIADAVNVAVPGQVDANLDRRTGTLAGTLTEQESGDPLEEAWVVAIGPSGPAGRAITTEDGDYEIPGLAPGTYRLAFVDPLGLRVTEYFDDAADFFAATPLPVTAGDVTTADEALVLG